MKTTACLEVIDLSIEYSDGHRAVKDLTMNIDRNAVTAIIGPSGCGKSTALRAFNRMNELIPGTKTSGQVLFRGANIYGSGVDPVEVRRWIGMVFQKPNPFPKTIYENIAWGARINGYRGDMDELVESSLFQVALWDEVKDKLKQSAMALSGGQQQRLCIARALAVSPEVILMDEPTSALDPISTAKIEDLLGQLKSRYSIVIVTHNMQQAARISDFTAFLLSGDLVEYAPTKEVFFNPKDERTENYISGRFG
ncbi:MAG: phosphate ABC transporter ATP-binding protein PstB [Spirochaetia bacterium]|jgi:phosphate transport system ATP-binding protein|uniref:Phosphate transporter subunit ATP-binding component of ABC superfamily n=2 Tax=root TaxID=1 RepID=A0A652ZRQ5_9SPIR|nr:phosphate ABC transporter ATP-binding protein PstB [Spirochaetia bacterium]MDD3819989.1 phosphate ABC transporter ATP-binding protein PstB [Spirochaetales bacterium]NLX46001.1 phosphate ABC transporter ATP-binding protein [Treponema sp.]VBB38444.1 phosphate transporter subunit; ATP-binding component of ABC superfamily [uncultured Spirochaetota bacterium]MCE1209176.1 phosphate ABC transporter ATP-binding protein PstB [Spirochaetia bacterium]